MSGSKTKRKTSGGKRGAGPRRTDSSRAYEARKDRERRRQAELARSGADLEKIPKCRGPKRRAKAEASLKAACETYFAGRFPLKWAPHHLDELTHIERVIRHGGKQVIGDPRGDGKTTRLEVAIIWAVMMAGLHHYAALLTAIGKHAPKRISSIKTALLTNDLLLADFPEVCYPIRKMAGVANRANAMHVDGKLCWPAAESVWSKNRIVLPTIEGSPCSGAVIEAAGLLEATRGLNHATADGRIIRPTIALIDDPQTNRSARSALQCEEREQALSAGILHLCGPGRTMSALASVTVIQQGDMADRMLDRDLHPEWHGIRNKMLVSWPERMDLWDQYADVYRDDLAAGRDAKRAARFYRKNKKRMNAGAAVTWPERTDGASTAIENAMRKFIEDRASFFSEMQNEPEADTADATVELLPATEIAAKVSGYGRGEIPPNAERLTWFVDVHKELLYYAVCAWAPAFTGWVVDYGTWPAQTAKYFDLRHARQTIGTDRRITAGTVEGRVVQALEMLYAEMSALKWKRADGAVVELELGLTDAGWATDEVFAVTSTARRKHGLKVMPSFGQAFGAGKRPISQWQQYKGTRGEEWHIPPPGRGRAIRHVLFDAGRRKTFLQRRINTPIGDAGGLSLFHAPASRHRLISEHLTAERGTEVSGPYGELVTWTLLPGRDNHWLDCLSGCCTAESILGGRVASQLAAPGDKKKIKLSDLRNKKRAR